MRERSQLNSDCGRQPNGGQSPPGRVRYFIVEEDDKEKETDEEEETEEVVCLSLFDLFLFSCTRGCFACKKLSANAIPFEV